MKRFYRFATVIGLGAAGLAAQEPAQNRMKIEAETLQARIVEVRGALIGNTVKNAPYSATEINESNQVLADGTRIQNETRTTVYRDSEGRLRRETPTNVTIWDPVGNASYVLDPQKMTARKINVGTFSFNSSGGGSGNRVVELRTTMSSIGHSPLAAEKIKADLASAEVELQRHAEQLHSVNAEGTKFEAAVPPPEKMQVEYHPVQAMPATVAMTGGGGGVVRVGSQMGSASMEVVTISDSGGPPTVEQLGKQMMEGVNAEGTRTTSTIAAGEIGNDRPIKIVSERWYSSDLQTLVMSRQTDPRMGENSFRLINVSRSEPAAYLFQVPSAYQMLDK